MIVGPPGSRGPAPVGERPAVGGGCGTDRARWKWRRSVAAVLHDGRPAGVQLIGPRFGEHACLDAAAVVEAAADPITPVTPRER